MPRNLRLDDLASRYRGCGAQASGTDRGLTAPAVGAAMAELIMTGTAKIADLSPFSHTRFMTGKLIAGEHEYTMGSDFGHTL